jgi:hypothetical protein
MISALKANKENGAFSLTRSVLAVWVLGLMVSYFIVLLLVVRSDVITLNGVEQFRYEWSRFSGALTFGGTTFGALIVQYLGKQWIKTKNGGDE